MKQYTGKTPDFLPNTSALQNADSIQKDKKDRRSMKAQPLSSSLISEYRFR